MKDNAIAIDPESQIRKPKSLIFAKAKENLPTTANRLWYAVLAEIAKRPKHETGTSFVINGKDIAELANLPPNIVGQQLQELYENSAKLAGYTLEIMEDDGNPITVSMISSAKYFKNSRAIRVTIDPNLLPYLQDYVGQIGVTYALGGPMKFKCIYTSPLFDLMNYYLGQETVEFTVAEMRKYIHVPEGKLTTITNLNARAIYPAVKEINKYTDLEIICDAIKKGRSTEGYKFVIKKKDGSFLDVEDPVERKTMSLIQKLISKPYEVNKDLVFQLLQEYGIDSCAVNFEYTKKQKYNNFIKYYRHCLKNKIGEIELEKEQLRAADFAKYKNIQPLEWQPNLFDEAENSMYQENEMAKTMTEEDIAALDENLKQTNPALYAIKKKLESNMQKHEEE